MKPSIRALGVKDKRGKLLSAYEASKRNKKSETKLIDITLDQITDHLVMIYFIDFKESNMDEVISKFEEKYEVRLRSSKDRNGKTYYWRVINTNSSSFDNNISREARRAHWRRETPEILNDEYADHWMDLADALGCDPLTLSQNLD